MTKDIHDAINQIYGKVGYVQKKGKVDMGGNRSYKFAGEAEFIAAIRPEMTALGIYQHPHSTQVISNERIESEKEWNGKLTKSYQFRVVINTIYRFVHSPTGTYIDVPAFGEGMDSGDKSFNKAMTGANKYALRQLFMIETGDDPDNHASAPEGGIIEKPAKGAKEVYGTHTAMKKKYVEILDLMDGALTHDQLKEVWIANQTHIKAIGAMDEQFKYDLDQHKEACKAKITEEEANQLSRGKL